MDISRMQADRLLDPANTSVTPHPLYKAAAALGKRLHVRLEEAEEPAASIRGQRRFPTSGFWRY